MKQCFRLSNFLLLILTLGCGSNDTDKQPVLRLAVTTSTRDSGILDELVKGFCETHPVRVDVIAVGSGAALQLGEAGDVDALLVHAREAELAFMAAGHGSRREEFMYNEFQLLGPPQDPAGIARLEPSAALLRLADNGSPWVSRGDNSGTHQRELELWNAANGLQTWDAFVDSGQGMGATLTMADELQAYVLCDQGTFLRYRQKIELVPLVASSDSLRNPYSVLVVDPQKHPSIQGKLAIAFAEFLIGDKAQRIIRDYKIGGQQAFYPLRLSGI